MRHAAILALALCLSNLLLCNAALLHNLVYWTPHKTGSTSMRCWLRGLMKSNNFSALISGNYYPFSKPADWHSRGSKDGKLANCSFITGHINIPRVDERRRENELGRVVTTTRDVVDTYLSKYYHRTWTSFSEDKVSESAVRLDLLWYFVGVDPCETLRYYDGIPGCNLEETNLLKRIDRIVDRIDCAIDTDDAVEDVSRLCEMMQLKTCADFGRRNSKGEDRYAKIKEDDTLRAEIERALKPSEILRQKLLMKRCAYLKDEQSDRWPHPGCGPM